MKRRYKYGPIILLPFLIWFYICLPDPLFDTSYSTVISDHEGVLLGASTAKDQQWRFPLSDSIPEKFETCIIQFEDAHFYRHPGVNPISLAKALYQNIRQGKVVRGGSTLSMQVIRLARKGKRRTYLEKLHECLLAMRLELKYSKEKVLQMYAAHAPFGGNVVGLEASSWRYYNRSPHQLSWGETATLAVLPNAPSLIFPGKNHDLLLAKRNRLLDKLTAHGILDSTDAILAKEEPLPGKPYPLPQTSTHLLDYYTQRYPKGKAIESTIDLELQKRIENTLDNHHRLLAQNHIHNAAILIVENSTGAIKTYIGNTRDAQNRYENAVDIIRAPRSSGSTLKPFLYAKMQEKGAILPHTILPDIPTYIAGYAPKNFSRKFDGAVPASQALARSLNIPAVRMLRDYGVEIFLDDLEQIGFPTINKSSDHYGLSLILGGAEVTLWDLVDNYRKLALGVMSHHSPLSTFEMHLSSAEKEQLNTEAIPFDAGSAWLTLEALTDMERPLEGGNWQQFSSSKTIAWKTGTSFGHRDAWAIGVTPDYTVGVWVGNADGESRPGLTGTSSAAPILFNVFKKLPSNQWFDAPESNLTLIKICRQSGYKASALCPDIEEHFVADQGAQTSLCPFHERVHLDRGEQYRVNANCYSVSEMVTKAWFVLPPAMEWFYKSKNPYYKPLPDFLTDCVSETINLEIIYPQPNARLFIPKGFDGQKEKLVFEAAYRSENTAIHWHLDNEFYTSTEALTKSKYNRT